jgi:hypothetical protein
MLNNFKEKGLLNDKLLAAIEELDVFEYPDSKIASWTELSNGRFKCSFCLKTVRTACKRCPNCHALMYMRDDDEE